MDEIQLLHDIVSIPSVTGREQELASFLLDFFSDVGINSWIDKAGNVVGEIGRGHPSMVLLGHLDTVPGYIPVRIENGRLYARGAVDAKGPLAAMISAAIRGMSRDDFPHLLIIGAVEEEGSSKGAKHVVSYLDEPDYVIVGEPSGWNKITIGYRGSWVLTYQATTEIEHSANGTENALEIMVTFLHQARQLIFEFYQHDTLFESVTPSIIDFKTETDGLQLTVTSTVQLRIPPRVDTSQVIQKLQAIDEKIRIIEQSIIPPVMVPRSSSLARSFARVIRQHQEKPIFTKKLGTSDMCILAQHWSCPIVSYGPGNPSLSHTPRESIDLSEYQNGIEVLYQVLKTLATNY